MCGCMYFAALLMIILRVSLYWLVLKLMSKPADIQFFYFFCPDLTRQVIKKIFIFTAWQVRYVEKKPIIVQNMTVLAYAFDIQDSR